MEFYTDSQRRLQDQYESRPLADAVQFAIVETELNEQHTAFISTRDFFFLSTVNGSGEPTVSYKGGDVGTVKVLDPTTLAFPAYDGNGMFLSMGNIDDTAKIGMLFIDFETPNRVRVQATAELSRDDDLLAEYPGALFMVRARIDQVFVNCARYIHKHTRVETSKYVPDAEGNQPHPKWKRIDMIQGALSPDDQARTADTGTITQDEYGEALRTGDS